MSHKGTAADTAAQKIEARCAVRGQVPFFATMFLCHALKANDSACRAYASVLEEGIDRDGTPVITYSHTCRHHRSFFEGSKWITRYFGEIWDRRDPGLIPHRHVEYVLSSGAITVVRDDVSWIDLHGYSWYLYVLLARHCPGVSREWNPALCEKAQEMLWRRVDSIGPLNLSYADLRATIQGPAFVHELALCLRKFPTALYRRELSREDWLTAVKLILLLGDADEILTDPGLTQESLHVAKRSDLPVLSSLIDDGTLVKLLLDERAALYEKCIRGINVVTFREELLAVAWEPSRALDWCVDFEGDFTRDKR